VGNAIADYVYMVTAAGAILYSWGVHVMQMRKDSNRSNIGA